METFKLSTISKSELKRLILLREQGIENYPWLAADTIRLSEAEQQQINAVQSRLLNYQVHLMNEATIWARGVYPLLLLAEQGHIQAWAEVAIQANYPQFRLEGIADGILGRCTTDTIEAPYLVMVEAKRGLEAQNPVTQLYGQLLIAAHQNWEADQQEPQEVFGCYTIADSWTFVRAEVGQIESDHPVLQVEASREFGAKLEATTIAKILKAIVARYVEPPLGKGK